MILRIKRLHDFVHLPEYKTEGSAGLDLQSTERFTLNRGEIKVVPTGIAIELEPGYEAQVRPRSGLAVKGITVVNSPGTIDSDYRGEIKVIIANIGRESQSFAAGDRIAQMVIAPYTKAEIYEENELTDTVRGSGGFGSTGK